MIMYDLGIINSINAKITILMKYSILNHNIILNNNENLYRWKISENNKCYVWGEVDGIEQHVFIC